MLYQAYNLLIDSKIEFPELNPAAGTRPPDVMIRPGPCPAHLIDPMATGRSFQANDSQLLLTVRRAGRFLVQGGNEIIYQPAPNAPDRVVRLYLLGSCLGALFHQRGLFALHASAIQVNDRAVLFAGRSGSGKSTLLGKFLELGYPMLADDICAISLDGQEGPAVLPAFPRSKVWSDTAEILGYEPAGLERIHPEFEKYSLSLAGRLARTPVKPAIIYLLTPDDCDELRIRPVDPLHTFTVLLGQTYRRQYLRGLGLRNQHFRNLARVAQLVTVRRISRPFRQDRLDALVRLIGDDFQAALSPPGANHGW